MTTCSPGKARNAYARVILHRVELDHWVWFGIRNDMDMGNVEQAVPIGNLPTKKAPAMNQPEMLYCSVKYCIFLVARRCLSPFTLTASLVSAGRAFADCCGQKDSTGHHNTRTPCLSTRCRDDRPSCIISYRNSIVPS